MRVFVCRDRKSGDVVDVLDAAKHTPSPDVLRVFDVTEEDRTPIEVSDLKGENLVEQVLLRAASQVEMDAELDRRGLTAIAKKLAVDGRIG